MLWLGDTPYLKGLGGCEHHYGKKVIRDEDGTMRFAWGDAADEFIEKHEKTVEARRKASLSS